MIPTADQAASTAKSIQTLPDRRMAIAQAVESIMEEAQVFASAWSLVGGPFDCGDGMENAASAKQELRETVERFIAALAAAPAEQAGAADADRLKWMVSHLHEVGHKFNRDGSLKAITLIVKPTVTASAGMVKHALESLDSART
ncbi:MAG: hypothetical protein EON56_03955, partial [Alphaproteobacteria bacterium]